LKTTGKLLIALFLALPLFSVGQQAIVTLDGKTDGDSITIVELRRAKGILVRSIDSDNLYRIRNYTVTAKRNSSKRGYSEPVFKQEDALFDHELMNFIVNRLQVGDFLDITDVKAVDSSGLEAFVQDIRLVVKAEPWIAPKFLASYHMACPNGIRNDRTEELLNVRSGTVSLEELKNSSRLLLWDKDMDRPGFKIEHFNLTIKRGIGKSTIQFSSDSAEFSDKLTSFIRDHLENGDELRFSDIKVGVDSTSYIVPGLRLIVDAPFYADVETRTFISVKGRIVTDNEEKTGIPNLTVTILVDDKDYRYRAECDKNGGFVVDELLQGSNYKFEVESTEEVPEGTALMLLNQQGFAVKQLSVGEVTSVSDEELDVLDQRYALNNLSLDSLIDNKTAEMPFSLHLNFSNSDELLRNSKQEVVKVINFLKMNPDYHVDFVVYTDTRGNDMVNILVTEQRAYKITNFMLKHGISYDRISYSGGGEAKIINHCRNDVECTEKEHQVNRRIEFLLYKS